MKTILSSRKMKIRAVTLGKTLEAAGAEAGMKNGYIYRTGDKDTVTLNTINRIAQALDCSVCDLLEEIEEVTPATPTPAQSVASKASATLRQSKRSELNPLRSESLPDISQTPDAAEAKRRAELVEKVMQRNGGRL